MNEIPAARQAELARELLRLRRRFWKLCGWVLLCVAIVCPVLALGDRVNVYVKNTLLSICIPIFLICCVRSAFIKHAILYYRCPRCGKKFGASPNDSWQSERCQHCGLELSEQTARE
jgi:DNA-directed RNA polymerase subunit RPC12/RpoP